VEAGQQIKDLKIRLIPLGVIAGRVLDADGEPVPGARVSAERYVYTAGKKELRTVSQVQTGDKGEFRLFGLGAGTFFLMATHGRFSPIGLPQSVSTFFPSAADQAHAAPVELRTGAQLQGFDIRLQSTGLYSVRFEFPEGHALEGSLAPRLVGEQGTRYFGPMSVSNDLVFLGVSPGSYDAIIGLDDEGKMSYAIQHVEVTNADVDGGTLTFVPGVDVKGTVRVEGGPFNGLETLRLNLESEYRTAGLGSVMAAMKPDGSFLIKAAVPQVYELALARTPGVYLKSIRAGDKQLDNRRIDLSSKLGHLTVVLGADAGEVEGTVLNAKGEPVARARVNAIAYGDHAAWGGLNRFGFSDDKGEFKIKDVPPGEYKVFAWEDVPVGAPQDPEFRKPFEKQAPTLRMPPNGSEKMQVTAISKAQVDRLSQ